MLDVLIGQLGTASGPVFVALLVISVAATAVAIFKIVQFQRMGVGRLQGAQRAVSLWLAGNRIDAVEEAGREASPVSVTVLAAMKSLTRHPADPRRAQEIAAQTAVDQLATMSRHLRFLEAVVQAAPMLGLLGTVMGMISAFGELSKGGGAIDPSALATGIWTALLTTAAGLAIAIPLYFVWMWLDGRVDEERTVLDGAIGAVLLGVGPADAARQTAATATDVGAAWPAGI